MKAKTTPQQHQEKIALKTLKMNPIMGAMMGGPSQDEAMSFLKSIGYSESELKRLMK